ncbi:hypothetical protein A1Q1_05184 [Trichosporon asahii var. asahii CBS 2479]|uniref:Uncharacterized protein n=1 Tax=Trichosporon asahii var. asahii (strain ATCC 90039 / CBS 2479 / JCM 2466 / KCTC 7840 / NBRC 103889/ NCYC 2677 / UAMH 7654) TaxID=1186058 RepID=J6ETX4_TRIAS|nr:hypothetical protein A1Q1_05184 [Trichosporon asahii var. asahii CBS 2479]EJT46227.1 hypothetical protein A1Q1_05184 [Trichosporon asahii var. asahii CBS 2479]
MDLSGLDSSLPAGLADAERDMTDKFRGKLSRGVKLTTAAALSITNLYKTSLGNTKQAYQVGYSAALADVLSKVQSDIGAGEDAAVALARLMDWTEARQDNDDEAPAPTKPRAARPSSAPAPSMPRYTAPGPSSLSQRTDQMEEDSTPSRPVRADAIPASSPIMSPAPARPGVKTMRSATRVPTSSHAAPAGAFNFSVPIPVNVTTSEEASPSQVGPTGAKRPMENQGEPSTPRGRAAKRRNEGQRGGRRRPSPGSSVSS